MTKYARPLILALALLALVASIAALYVHYRILKDPTYTSFCDINETVSCEAVLESPYATVRGVPVAAGGVIWSTLVLLIAATGLRRDNTDAYAAAAGYIFVLATIGLSAVLYLGYASFFVIGKMCPLCMTMYVSVIGIFLVSGGTSMALSALPSRLSSDLRSVVKSPALAVLALLFIVGSVSLVAFFPRAEEQTVTTASEVYTPPTETIDPDQLAEFNKWIDAQPRVNVPVPANGAQVLIVKFNDYQCPSCRQTYMEYKGILAKYQNNPKVRFVTMDFPLDSECNTAGIHGSACEAAAAVRMAKAKGKGAEMEEYLFSNQEKFTPTWVKDAAKQVAGITDFDTEYPKVLEQVKADAALGRQLDVQATPTFFINGLKINGGFRPVFFEAVIEHELKKGSAS
jgi:Predicted membrane protein